MTNKLLKVAAAKSPCSNVHVTGTTCSDVFFYFCYFPVNLVIFLRTPFLIDNFWWLLLECLAVKLFTWNFLQLSICDSTHSHNRTSWLDILYYIIFLWATLFWSRAKISKWSKTYSIILILCFFKKSKLFLKSGGIARNAPPELRHWSLQGLLILLVESSCK